MEQNLVTAIEQMRNGSEEGFNTVYSNTYNRVYFRAKQLMKKEEDAQDLVQIVFVEAYQNISSLQSAEALYGWLDGITYNQGMKLFRKQRDVLLSEEAEGMFDALENNDVSAMPELTADQKETAAIIKGIIEELPELQRAAVVAYYYDGMKVEKIADLMECSVGTIKSRLNYARKYIKERVEEKEKKEGYRLHVFGLPVLYFALRMLATETKLATSAAQGIYNSACGAVGLQATVLGATGAATAATTAAGATSATAAGGTAVGGSAAGAGVASGAASATAAGIGTTMKALIIAGSIAVAGAGTAGTLYLLNAGHEEDAVVSQSTEALPDATEPESGTEPEEKLPQISLDEIDLSEYSAYQFGNKDETSLNADNFYLQIDESGKNCSGYWTVEGQPFYFKGKIGAPLTLTDLRGEAVNEQMTILPSLPDSQFFSLDYIRIYWNTPYVEGKEPSYYYYQAGGLHMEEMDKFVLKDLYPYKPYSENEFFKDFTFLFPKKEFWYNDYAMTYDGLDLMLHILLLDKDSHYVVTYLNGMDAVSEEKGAYLYYNEPKTKEQAAGQEPTYVKSYAVKRGDYYLVVQLYYYTIGAHKRVESARQSDVMQKVETLYLDKIFEEFQPAFEEVLISNME